MKQFTWFCITLSHVNIYLLPFSVDLYFSNYHISSSENDIAIMSLNPQYRTEYIYVIVLQLQNYIWIFSYLEAIPLKTTSCRRQCDIMTSHWRRYDVVSTSRACWVLIYWIMYMYLYFVYKTDIGKYITCVGGTDEKMGSSKKKRL